MNAWLAVIQELTAFVIEELNRLFFGYRHAVSAYRHEVVPPIFLPPRTEAALPTELPSTIHPIIPDILHEPIVMYVAVPDALCFTHPHDDFDGVVSVFSYGEAVTVVSFFGRYARIMRQETVGWMFKDDISQYKSSVWPALMVGTVYDAGSEVAIKIRLVLRDIFRAGVLGLPLQAGEYILYRLRLDNRVIIWPSVRPRTPGHWQKVLRGDAAIHIGITPKTDTVMEWFTSEFEGRLAYVEKVLPDTTIELSMVGYKTAGEFSVVTLSPEQWRELRPVFIELK